MRGISVKSSRTGILPVLSARIEHAWLTAIPRVAPLFTFPRNDGTRVIANQSEISYSGCRVDQVSYCIKTRKRAPSFRIDGSALVGMPESD